VVVKYAGVKSGVRWKCLCDCGADTVVSASRLKNGDTKSCGCGKITRGLFRAGVGNTNKPEVGNWKSMMSRCLDATADNYDQYGGSGITVCERWKDFSLFLADMGEKPSPHHSIDRIDGTKGYEPGNCRWATKKQQMDNRRLTVWIEYEGQRLTINDWAERTGLPPRLLRARWRMRWDAKRMLTEPSHEVPKYEFGGRSMTLDEWGDAVGVAGATLKKRIAAGWSLVDTLTKPSKRGKKK
jgi:hypothetical protein